MAPRSAKGTVHHGLTVIKETALSLVCAGTTSRAGGIECSACAEVIRAHQGTAANAAQECGLGRLNRNQAPEDMEYVHEFRRVLGEPTSRLNLFELGRLSAISDDGPRAVETPVAEPLHEHLLARDFVLPHRWLDVVNAIKISTTMVNCVVMRCCRCWWARAM